MKHFIPTGSGLSLKNNDETSWHKNHDIFHWQKLKWENLTLRGGNTCVEENIKSLSSFGFDAVIVLLMSSMKITGYYVVKRVKA